MATLHVTDVPDDLYGRIREMAAADSRSLSGEVLALLDRAVRDEQRRAAHVEALASILGRRRVFKNKENMPDSTELLREDRAR